MNRIRLTQCRVQKQPLYSVPKRRVLLPHNYESLLTGYLLSTGTSFPSPSALSYPPFPFRIVCIILSEFQRSPSVLVFFSPSIQISRYIKMGYGHVQTFPVHYLHSLDHLAVRALLGRAHIPVSFDFNLHTYWRTPCMKDQPVYTGQRRKARSCIH